MSDPIERQDVIDAFDLPIYNIKGRENAERVIEYLKAVIQRIKDLPSAQPERKKGKWIIKNKDSYACECPECKKENVYAYIFDYDINAYRQQDWFCPNCGADLRGEE